MFDPATDTSNIEERFAEMQTRLSEMESTIAQLREEKVAPQPAVSGRRALLRTAGVAAATAVATATLGREAPARAANGDPFITGGGNFASGPTFLVPVAGSNPSELLGVDNTDSSAGTAIVANGGGPTGIGLWGIANGGTNAAAVLGVSNSGYGVVGLSYSGIAVLANGTGRLQQKITDASGPPTLGTYGIGEQIRDASGEMYICTASGSPGTWKKVLTAPAGVVSGTLSFLPAPIRLLDTRLNPGVKQAAGSTYVLQITGVTINSTTIPAGAKGVIGNVTVVSPDNYGYLTLFPTGAPLPTASNINYFTTPIVLANSAVVGLSASGQLSIYCNNGNTHVLFDASAYVV